MNRLDKFIEAGNRVSSPIIDDEFVFGGTTYLGTVSDIIADEFLNPEATGRRRNEERTLEVPLIRFGSVTPPTFGDTITYLTKTYMIIEIESKDTTNIMYRIRRLNN